MPATQNSSTKRRKGQPKPQAVQRNYAITVGDTFIVLKTVVPGTLYIITADDQRKCIEIKVEPISGKAHRRSQTEIGDLNVTATVRTLTEDGTPIKQEKIEPGTELQIGLGEWDEDEKKFIPDEATNAVSASAAPASDWSEEETKFTPDVRSPSPASEDAPCSPQGTVSSMWPSIHSTTHKLTHQPLPSAQPEARTEAPASRASSSSLASGSRPTRGPAPPASSPFAPRNLPRSLAFLSTPTMCMPQSRYSASPEPTMQPPPVPTTPSLKKRGASEMDPEPVEAGSPEASGSRKRVRAAEKATGETPSRVLPRKRTSPKS
ncbi:hypothetical protein DFH06DRAFT_1184211 [Mycena polygramma]|nr:hypothetical protein DFH06DRAFT_1184211 [Mycena polygramma]